MKTQGTLKGSHARVSPAPGTHSKVNSKVLTLPGPRSSLVTFPDLVGEFEVLRVGRVTGAKPTVLEL